MEAKFFFINLGRAVLRAAPYFVLAAQVIDLVNKGLGDASEPAKTNIGDNEEDPLSVSIQ
jgi:hypothetical protein